MSSGARLENLVSCVSFQARSTSLLHFPSSLKVKHLLKEKESKSSKLFSTLSPKVLSVFIFLLQILEPLTEKSSRMPWCSIICLDLDIFRPNSKTAEDCEVHTLS